MRGSAGLLHSCGFGASEGRERRKTTRKEIRPMAPVGDSTLRGATVLRSSHVRSKACRSAGLVAVIHCQFISAKCSCDGLKQNASLKPRQVC